MTNGGTQVRSNGLAYMLRVFLVAALTIALASVAYAQTPTATLSGTVMDEQGAVVPGAKVTLENPRTGLRREAVTSSAGYFVFSLLLPGTYTVGVLREGFTPVTTEVTLNVGDQRALQIPLKVG